MAFGTKYRLEYYDRFDNAICVNLQQDGYTGAVIEVNGSNSPLSIHWMGEGDDRKVFRGSTCKFNVISETDQQFLSLFTGTSRDYKIVVEKDGSTFWTGFVDPDSYKEPFLHVPYVSTIHASDGLGELKNIPFPTPSSAVYQTLSQSLIYYLSQALKETGHDLQIYVANNVSFTGATRVFENTYVEHFNFRDEENVFISCYDVIEKILTSFDCRIYQKYGRWYVERVPYLRQNISYVIYSADGVYQTTSAGADPSLTMTGVDGDPMCVWKDQSPDMEIVPAWREFTVKQEPGERSNIIKFTNRMGEFIDEEFERPVSAGVLEARFWTLYDNVTTGLPPSPQWGHTTATKYPGTTYWQIRGRCHPSIEYKNFWGQVRSDPVTLERQSYNVYGSLQFKLNFNAAIDSDNPYLFYYKPFLRYNIKMTFPDSDFSGTREAGQVISSPGNTLVLYLRESSDGKIYPTQESDWTYEWPATSHPYPVPGINSTQFKELGERESFEITTEQIRFEKGYNEQPTVELFIFPLATTYYLEGGIPNTYPVVDYDYTLDIYEARVQIVNSDIEADTETLVSVNDDNRFIPSDLLYWFTGNQPLYNKKFFHRFVFLKSDGSNIEATWTVDGDGQMALIGQVSLLEHLAAHGRPLRKLNGELVADPEDMDYGKVLIDDYGKKYICTGVEYDVKQGFWNGEWIQLYDPDTVDAGDYDADDFSTGDFWAI